MQGQFRTTLQRVFDPLYLLLLVSDTRTREDGDLRAVAGVVGTAVEDIRSVFLSVAACAYDVTQIRYLSVSPCPSCLFHLRTILTGERDNEIFIQLFQVLQLQPNHNNTHAQNDSTRLF